MKWSIARTKAKFSEVVRRAQKEPQFVENRGERVAVVVSAAEFERLRRADRGPDPTPVQKWLRLCDELRANGELVELEIPPREPEPFPERGLFDEAD